MAPDRRCLSSLMRSVLRALGWDVEDLEDVKLEYRRRPSDNPVDYALFILRTPRLFIEAKALGGHLDDGKWAAPAARARRRAGPAPQRQARRQRPREPGAGGQDQGPVAVARRHRRRRALLRQLRRPVARQLPGREEGGAVMTRTELPEGWHLDTTQRGTSGPATTRHPARTSPASPTDSPWATRSRARSPSSVAPGSRSAEGRGGRQR